ncbi:MAG: YggT family protein [Hydrogenophilus sp.]|nr:YggT family protein [Hydrogenophilus sp.]
MGAAIFDLIAATVFNGWTALFWLAFLMRWQRVSFFVPGGAFIAQTTEWAAAPVRRWLPRTRLDWSVTLWAWWVQGIYVLLRAVVLGHAASLPPVGLAIAVVVGGAIEALYVLGHLVFWLTIASALLSWVQPRAPLAPVVHALVAPFLQPIQRWVPVVGGVDLSPVVLLLLLNLLAIVGGEVRFAVMRGILAATAG